ncbi:hypothetical protein FBU30_010714 [Linnemannia zychae]|nr:hypothetical protein FBU30_010714 [Linnemannia zychae]
MFGSFASLVGALVLSLTATVAAQDQALYCGGYVENGLEGTFEVKYIGVEYTALTMRGLNSNSQSNETYILYCNQQMEPLALTSYNLPSNTPQFKVPVNNVLVGGSYTSSYVELAGGRSKIKVLENPQDIVSPCLQALVKNGSITALDDSNWALYNNIDVGFRVNQHIGQVKDVWIPMSVDVKPLLRVDYITAVSLFFNNGIYGQTTAANIKGAYSTVKGDMAVIPQANKKRIGWVKYDFQRKTWTLRNSEFTRGIIIDAGGVPFPLNGDSVSDNAGISPNDFKILVQNADVIIDQTEFNNDKGGYTSFYEYWCALAGFPGAQKPPVLDLKKLFTLDNTMNLVGDSDYQYRMPSRPDLLLRDVVAAQYPDYDPNYKYRFLNDNFQYGGRSDNQLGSDQCDVFPYNSGDISVSPSKPYTSSVPRPPLQGGGIYGAGGDSQGDSNGSSGGSKTKSIIIAVVCVAAILAAAFGFAFYKWSHRAKEDRFIELEEEMNNEIPLH